MGSVPTISIFEDELNLLKDKNLYRTLRTIDSKKYISFSSNNYLGLANNEFLKSESIKAIKKYGTGASASRLISGNFAIHEELERKIAKFKNKLWLSYKE